MAKIELDGGKYTVVNELSEGGGFYALRYGRVWSNLAGDKLALSMFHEIERLRESIKTAERELWWGSPESACIRVSDLLKEVLESDLTT